MKKNHSIKRLLRGVLSVTMACGAVLGAQAIPAKRGVLQVEQPDGTQLEVYLQGDEWGHLYTTTDGYPLLYDDNVGYVYADVKSDGTLTSSGIRARNVSSRQATDRMFLQTVNKDNVKLERRGPQKKSTRGVGLFPNSTFPVKGEQKILVILVEFQDVAFGSKNRAAYDYSTIAPEYTAHDYFSDMLNQDGFSHFGGTGSCREWFLFNSRDEEGNPQFSPEFDVFGPVKLTKDVSAYGQNDFNGSDANPDLMVMEACQLLDEEIDFSQYDRNNDGFVDNVYIFYAGYGEADGGGKDTVWPHSWNLASAGQTLILDGVQIDRYGCSNETDHTAGRPDGIGTFTHEFSHVMGLPDLYATSYTNSFTPGEFSVMDYGPYNNDGRTPPNYSAFERIALDWMTPRTFEVGEDDYVLPVMVDTNVAYKVYCMDKNGYINTKEYFLCESRPQDGNDKYIPAGGMLIWHVDYNERVWTANTVNNTPTHQYVDLIEANGIRSERGRLGHPFPGADNVTEYEFRGWGGRDCKVKFSEIAEVTDNDEPGEPEDPENPENPDGSENSEYSENSDNSDPAPAVGSIRVHVVNEYEPVEKPDPNDPNDPGNSGVESIDSDEEVVGIYSLQGVRLAEPPAQGMYILRTTRGAYKLGK